MDLSPIPDSSLPDLSLCDVEPIHIPGSIQPHGLLMALHEADLTVTQVSSNCAALLGIAAENILHQKIEDVLDPALGERIRQALTAYRKTDCNPVAFDWHPSQGMEAFVGYVHTSDASVILELEPGTPDHDGFQADDWRRILNDFARVRAEMDVRGKARAAAQVFQQLTGYDRVMIYRFDPDWHGEVIGEACRSDLESYLGLHYPASDIPAQARRLFLISPTRVIVDIGATPAALLPLLSPVTEKPLDLSRSLLRSVSPVHVEYLGNMGVTGTLTAPIIREGALWGLIACHHQTRHPVPRHMRETLGWLTQDLATQMVLAEEVGSRRYASRLKGCRERVIYAMRNGVRLAALLDRPALSDVLGAIGAEGVALIRATDVVTGGVTPPPGRIRQLADALSNLHPDAAAALFLTDCLSEHLADAMDLAETAAGVALFPLEANPSLKLMWFRGERLRHVTWGGNPEKILDSDTGRLSPRRSFAAWTEIVSLHSLPWTEEEVDSAKALTTLVDIELRKSAEEALRETNRRKDEFIAMLGHELRNPLAPIRHAAEILLLGPSPDRVQWAAGILGRQVKHLTRLLDDLLDVARINRGKLTLHVQTMDLRKAAERAIEQVRPILDAHHQTLDLLFPRTPIEVEGDFERLTQVIVNLLVNASKFSPTGIPISLKIDVSADEASIEVRDQGIGVEQLLMPHIFTPFTQGAQTKERSHGGLGLGLALVKGLVELHGGRVLAMSAGAKCGSTFTISLPLSGHTALTPTDQVTEQSTSTRVVLVVDDNPDVAESCVLLLHCLNQQAHRVHDGPAALEAMARIHPDLILLDIGLPGMNGFEVARRIRATPQGKAVRLVALTGYGQERDLQESREAGFDEHILKPVDSRTLLDLLERIEPKPRPHAF